jgi:hypothetical protein
MFEQQINPSLQSKYLARVSDCGTGANSVGTGSAKVRYHLGGAQNIVDLHLRNKQESIGLHTVATGCALSVAVTLQFSNKKVVMRRMRTQT